MSNEKIKQKAKKVNALLKKEYPIVKTPLHHKNAWELLIAVILSAQTLDETVNKVTPRLFKLYNSCYELAGANLAEVEEVIKGVNYYKTKAKNIIKTSQKLVENFDGKVPNKIEELTTLPGVGRKTANVIINEWFCRHDQKVLPQGFVVDTHVARVSKRLGFTKHSDPT
ncbi:MAG: hypothetical protein KatS3mg085_432 [Candidatus Dojkabacteria bacterium]|nr:MAG: hypothetical protein KatS3mg085_432 [Candidatus Dojkabacteria bacterium]